MIEFTRFTIKRLLYIAIFGILCPICTSAAIPAGYYRTCSGKSGAELKTALHKLLYTHNEVSSYNNLPNYFRKTDVYPPGDSRYGQWWDMYSNIPLSTRSFSGLNREHSLPKSWWGGATTTPAYVDLFHLYPSEMDANMAKSNYPLGEVRTATFDNSVVKVGYAVAGQGGGAKEVFEPADEYKGDFARTYFYMACCYQNLTWKYTYMLSNNTYPTLNPWSVQLLLKWNKEDPVSEKEKNRNEEVYKVQSNRNPFIDYPELAEYLWGTRKGQTWVPGAGGITTGNPQLLAPVNGLELQFGEVALGDDETSVVVFQGVDLTGPIELSINTYERTTDPDLKELYKKWASMFSIDTKSLSASNVNTESGTSLRVTYKPTEVGEHLAKLIIEGAPNESSRAVVIRGTGCPVPVLTKLEALDAINISDDSYTAVWTAAPESENVDYYLLTRTIYKGADTESEQIEVEASHSNITVEYPITDCTPGTKETYCVQSSRLGHLSEASNVITVDVAAGIADVATDNPLGWAAFPGGIRLMCGQPHTGVMIYDTLGRMVRRLEKIENNAIIELPYGAYFIITDQQRSPAKILVQP